MMLTSIVTSNFVIINHHRHRLFSLTFSLNLAPQTRFPARETPHLHNDASSHIAHVQQDAGCDVMSASIAGPAGKMPSISVSLFF